MFEVPVTGAYSLNLNANLTSEEQAALEDRALVSALQRADGQAYEILIRRFQSPVYNLAWRLLEDRSDAGDVVQEVFLKVFRNVDSFRGDSSLRTWIYRITVNESHNRRRWLFRHRKGETGIDDVYTGEDHREAPLVDSGETPFDFTMNHEAQSLLEEGLSTISPSLRTALVLREIEDMSYEEIARVLDVSMGTVKSRIVRGREALRRYLAVRLNPESSLQLAPGTPKWQEVKWETAE
jgi:RNA polymerase sigma-70 factor, ECF subfamily